MKNTIVCTAALAGLTLMLLSAHAKAARPNASTPTQAVLTLERQHRFSQTKIASCESLPSVLHWGVNEIRYVDGELTIQGMDKLGHHYSIVKGTGLPGCEVWAADFEGSGDADLVILTKGLDSSSGYDASLTFIFFDADGRPFPWQAVGKFTATDAGVDQILADPSSKGAKVIVPTKEGIEGAQTNLAYELYSFSPLKVEKVNDDFSGLRWPIFENATPALLKHRGAVSLTFDLDGNTPTSQIRSSSTSKITGTSALSLSNGKMVELPSLLVVDSACGDRSINADPMPADMERLVQAQAHIKTLGTACEEEECRPLVLLATP